MNTFLVSAFLIIAIVTMVYGAYLLTKYLSELSTTYNSKASSEIKDGYFAIYEQLIGDIAYKVINLKDDLTPSQQMKMVRSEFYRVAGTSAKVVIEICMPNADAWIDIVAWKYIH